jgi:hypothetical protein
VPAAEILYVYGVVERDARSGPPQTPPGIGGRPVCFVGHGDLQAAVSAVPSDQFGDDVLKASLNDLDWLGRTAREHEAVVEALLDAGPVVPMRLCTIFREDAGVRGMLEREESQLRAALARVRDTEELGVKVIARPTAGVEPGDAAELQTGGSEGEAYLLARRRDREQVEERRERIATWVADAHEVLAAVALDARVNPPSSRELDDYEGDMVLNAAYLVAVDDVPAFRRSVAELAERHGPHGLDLRLTGPWPPYNFTGAMGSP